ncbi:MAG: S1 RNA-binding domain-containing protein [Bacilli bacterium]|nr:S1 RNA-binding domain-containing protein [Bacilli bacterium]
MEVNSNYKVNDVVEGIVTKIKKYGAFLSFDYGYVGLLHISEISYNFVNNIDAYFKVGDKITVLINEINPDNKFLSVSIKRLPNELNPYKEILPSKRITSYLKDVDFSKLEKALPKMIEKELKKESENVKS